MRCKDNLSKKCNSCKKNISLQKKSSKVTNVTAEGFGPGPTQKGFVNTTTEGFGPRPNTKEFSPRPTLKEFSPRHTPKNILTKKKSVEKLLRITNHDMDRLQYQIYIQSLQQKVNFAILLEDKNQREIESLKNICKTYREEIQKLTTIISLIYKK
jgi:hypothetical protein